MLAFGLAGKGLPQRLFVYFEILYYFDELIDLLVFLLNYHEFDVSHKLADKVIVFRPKQPVLRLNQCLQVNFVGFCFLVHQYEILQLCN